MADDVKRIVREVIESNAEQFARASSVADVRQIAPDIASQVEREIEGPQGDPWSFRAVIVILGLIAIGMVILYGIHALTPLRSDGKAALGDLPESLVYNRRDVYMPHLLICRPEHADMVLAEVAGAAG